MNTPCTCPLERWSARFGDHATDCPSYKEKTRGKSAPLSPAAQEIEIDGELCWTPRQMDAISELLKAERERLSPAPAPLKELDKHDCYQSLVSMGSTDDNGRKRYQNECWLRCTKCGAQYAKSVVDASIDRSEAVSALSPQPPTSEHDDEVAMGLKQSRRLALILSDIRAIFDTNCVFTFDELPREVRKRIVGSPQPPTSEG